MVMKKIAAILLLIAPLSVAMANDYGAYDEYDVAIDDEYTECPACICQTDTDASRDNYIGLRVYKNEHAEYAYGRAHGAKKRHQKDNFAFGTTVGNNLADFLRVEYETLYMGSKYRHHDTDYEYNIWANMLNAYLMHDFYHAASPYVGAGLGLTGIWGEIDGELDNAFDLSYQAMVGVLFHLNTRIDLDVGFKYVNYGRVEHRHGTTRIDATQIYVGATYNFGM